MSLTNHLISLAETKILLIEVSSGKRKALMEKILEHYFEFVSAKDKQTVLEAYKKFYPVFDYVFNNFLKVKKYYEEPTYIQNNFTISKFLHAREESFNKMSESIGFKNYYYDEQQKSIIECAFIAKMLFGSLESIDPTGNMKYGNWLVDEVLTYAFKHGYFGNRFEPSDHEKNVKVILKLKGTFFEDLPKLQSYLKHYDEAKKRNKLPDKYKDINQLLPLHVQDVMNGIDETVENPWDALNFVTKEFRTLKEKDVFKAIDAHLEEGEDYAFLGEFETFKVYTPLTQKGASILGMNTEWCTTYGEHCTNPDYQDRGSIFDQYDNLFILINKKNQDEKYQFHFETNQWMDKDDRMINLNRFLTEDKELFYFFLPYVSETIVEANASWILPDIKSDNSSAKVIASFMVDDNVKYELYEVYERTYIFTIDSKNLGDHIQWVHHNKKLALSAVRKRAKELSRGNKVTDINI